MLSLRVCWVGIINVHAENSGHPETKLAVSIMLLLQGRTLKYYNKISIFAFPNGSRYSIIISLLFSSIAKAAAPVV
jgi:hypothetical protein